MHIQIINFNLKGMSTDEYEKTCDQLANSFANIEGLIRKYWLTNSSDNTYGGVYVWKNKSSMEVFSHSELFNTVANHPNLENITSTDYGVIEGPTRITGGLIVEDQYVGSSS